MAHHPLRTDTAQHKSFLGCKRCLNTSDARSASNRVLGVYHSVCKMSQSVTMGCSTRSQSRVSRPAAYCADTAGRCWLHYIHSLPNSAAAKWKSESRAKLLQEQTVSRQLFQHAHIISSRTISIPDECISQVMSRMHSS